MNPHLTTPEIIWLIIFVVLQTAVLVGGLLHAAKSGDDAMDKFFNDKRKGPSPETGRKIWRKTFTK